MVMVCEVVDVFCCWCLWVFWFWLFEDVVGFDVVFVVFLGCWCWLWLLDVLGGCLWSVFMCCLDCGLVLELWFVLFVCVLIELIVFGLICFVVFVLENIIGCYVLFWIFNAVILPNDHNVLCACYCSWNWFGFSNVRNVCGAFHTQESLQGLMKMLDEIVSFHQKFVCVDDECCVCICLLWVWYLFEMNCCFVGVFRWY